MKNCSSKISKTISGREIVLEVLELQFFTQVPGGDREVLKFRSGEVLKFRAEIAKLLKTWVKIPELVCSRRG